MHEFDVLVVGKGNAALCSALSAHEHSVKIAMLEAALGVQLTTGQWLSFVPAGVGAVLIVRALRRDAVKGSR